MKSVIFLAFLMSTAFAAPSQSLLNVDSGTSKIEWIGKKVAGPHNGYIGIKNGTLSTTKEGTISSGKIIVDMNSMTNVDITDKDYNGKLIGHLKDKDFFDVAAFPEATLVIKNSTKSTKGLDVVGDLTIKGITQPVKFTATEIKSSADVFSAKATIMVDRTKHGIVYNAGKGDQSLIKQLGDKLIYDDFTLNISLSAKK